jgi:hypothetical protein
MSLRPRCRRRAAGEDGMGRPELGEVTEVGSPGRSSRPHSRSRSARRAPGLPRHGRHWPETAFGRSSNAGTRSQPVMAGCQHLRRRSVGEAQSTTPVACACMPPALQARAGSHRSTLRALPGVNSSRVVVAGPGRPHLCMAHGALKKETEGNATASDHYVVISPVHQALFAQQRRL